MLKDTGSERVGVRIIFERKEVRIMPYGDRTGPMGTGPMSGRGSGFCAGYGMPGYANPAHERGFWQRGAGGFFGPAGGRGRRNWFYATGLPGWVRGLRPRPFGAGLYASGNPEMDKAEELRALKGQADFYESGLAEIKKRITELESIEKSRE